MDFFFSLPYSRLSNPLFFLNRMGQSDCQNLRILWIFFSITLWFFADIICLHCQMQVICTVKSFATLLSSPCYSHWLSSFISLSLHKIVSAVFSEVFFFPFQESLFWCTCSGIQWFCWFVLGVKYIWSMVISAENQFKLNANCGWGWLCLYNDNTWEGMNPFLPVVMIWKRKYSVSEHLVCRVGFVCQF